jgi:glycosyltransferase involved in cell wall biosynthesis
MNNPLITVIIPVYNGAKSLKKALESVLSQRYTYWELLVINDGSSDNSEEIILNFAKIDNRIKYIKNSNNLGIQKTRNIALGMAQGEYIAEIDQDDEWLDVDKLKKQVDFLDSNKDYALVGTGVIVVDENEIEIARYLMPENDREIRNKILRRNCFIHSSVMYRTKAIIDIGGYTVEKMSEDHDLWLRIGHLGKFYNLQEYCVKYLYSPKGYNSQDKFVRLKQNLLFIKEHKDFYPNSIQAFILGWIKIFFYPIFKYAPTRIKGLFLKLHKKL